MKKLTALLLTLVLALSLTACGSNESKQLVGTWQCTVDITSQMDTEIGGALDAEYASETPMQMFLTAVFNDDGKEVIVHAGDICATGYGQHHGLENRTEEPVELIALIVME